ncbi:hypothetical protein [Leptospira stimsonii]|uniref:Uncharacterized protein n=1 Tax=Leptospira stimsonii TaxID=2202203 RepID=A0A396YLP3_9LEPT|nr:hypothetical protein [Leptospira stimsonii]RHX83655.1 hypothetical protein DLM75_23650 [Leptospira stimsonii]
MEYIDYIRNHDEYILGHELVDEHLNLKIEIARIRKNPFKDLIDKIEPDKWRFIKTEGVRLLQAYDW